MSCIAGLYHLRGEPVDGRWLDGMAAAMAARAPDGTQKLCSGPIAIAQCFLRTGSSGAEQPNPLSLDGDVYITADARVDDRARLLRELRSCGLDVEDDAPHAALILHAYRAFGENFLDHLLGDFAFALWDACQQRLVCARDHFGIRPLFYARHGELFAFASDVQALRSLPWVSTQLDPVGVGDFLLFGACAEPGRTIFRDIRKLPAATWMDVRGPDPAPSRYWQLPSRETRYRKPAEYVEHFSTVFDNAVADRLPQGSVGVQLSGGMDSTSIAAHAAAHATRSGSSLTAFNTSASKLLGNDPEEGLARLVAGHLRIDFVSQDLADYPLHDRALEPRMRTPVPFGSPQLALHLDTLEFMQARGARVLLSGFGADALFSPSADYCRALARDGRWFKLAREVAHHTRHARTLRGLGLRSLISGNRPPPVPSWQPELPSWLTSPWARRHGLRERWERWWEQYRAATDAQRQLQLPWLDRCFEAGESLPAPVVTRYPFLDRRLAEYLLSVPDFMLIRKKILRRAMLSRLPPEITTRPKTALGGDPVRRQFIAGNIVKHDACPGPAVDRAAHEEALQLFRAGAGSDSTWMSWLLFLPDSLANWLTYTGASYE